MAETIIPPPTGNTFLDLLNSPSSVREKNVSIQLRSAQEAIALDNHARATGSTPEYQAQLQTMCRPYRMRLTRTGC